jgi:NAD(P)-dependent dehydrogenase (short-subunit alcohol dehydrogenase family)
MTTTRTVLVTGASQGVGRAVAEGLAARGHRVFGTSRSPSGDHAGPVRMLPLDVTDPASVTAAVQDVLDAAGGLDVLVNNAGSALLGTAEEVDATELDAQLAVNFLGAVRMTRAVLPVMRARGGGRIITMSSLGGLTAPPYAGAYAASKFAVEGYMESLRHDVLAHGIAVSLVEPPNLRTATLATSIVRAASPIAAYEHGDRLVAAFREAGARSRHTPEHVARVVARIVESRRPRLRYALGVRTRALPLLKAVLPQVLFEAALRRSFALGPGAAEHDAVSARPARGTVHP